MLKSLPKIITTFFLIIFIFQLVCLFFLFIIPQASQAADPIKFTPQVKGLDYTFNSSDATTGNIANYVKAIYKYAIGIVGILAAVVLMIGGVMWIVAGGNATMIGEAKSWIGASLTGLLLALCSYLILATVNPALVNLKTSEVPTVEQINETLEGCFSGQGLCYSTCPSNWKELTQNTECSFQKCCVLYSGACQTAKPNGLGGSCRPTSEGCQTGEKQDLNGYCGGDTSVSICCVPN